jgi:hypothetical protein
MHRRLTIRTNRQNELYASKALLLTAIVAAAGRPYVVSHHGHAPLDRDGWR